MWAPQTGTPFCHSPVAEHGPKHQALAGAQMSLEGKVRGFGEQEGDSQLWTKGVKNTYEIGPERKGGKSLLP